MKRLMIVLTWVLLQSCAVTPNKPAERVTAGCPSQTWSGWAEVDGVGDFPFRVRALESSGSMDVSFAGIFNLELVDFDYQDQALQFVWVSSQGDRRVFSGTEAGTQITGPIDWAGSQGSFVLNCAATAIAAVDTEEAGFSLGWYLFDEPNHPTHSQVWAVQKAGYGEVYKRDLRSGQQRILFPALDGGFFTGKSLNDPSVITAEISVHEEQGATKIKLHDPESQQQFEGQAFELVTHEFIIQSAAGPLRVLVAERTLNPLGIGLVVVPGSAWQVAEDEKFRSENLAALGLTVITFDKRGYGQSSGEQIRPFAKTAEDAATVTRWASAAHPNINSWGVLGISRGGWMVPLIPNLNQLYDFAVLSVTPAVTPLVQEMTARLTKLAGQDFSAQQLALVDQYYQALVGFVRSNDANGWQKYAALHQQVQSFLPADFQGADESGDEEWHWWRLNGDHNPKSALQAIRIPTRVLLGTEDLNVDFASNHQLMNAYGIHKGVRYLQVLPMAGVGHNLSIPFDGPMWTLDTLGSEGLEEIWQWAIQHQ